jgi:hypothetical protein
MEQQFDIAFFLDSRRPTPASPADVPAESQFRKIIPRKRKHGYELSDEAKMATPNEVKLPQFQGEEDCANTMRNQQLECRSNR